MSQSIAVHLKPSEIVMLLACLREVNITDHRDDQLALKARLSRTLRRADPELHAQAVAVSVIEPEEIAA